MERRTPSGGSRLFGSGFATSAALALALASLAGATAQGGEEYPYFVRARTAGARVLNFQDRQEHVLRELKEGELMRVFGEDVDFLQVEAAGGLKVWVFGQYLKPADEQGVYSVTATGVNMRPKPEGTRASMPIRTKLQRGDLVRLIERADPSLPLAEDWVRVWSPQRARGWVLASEVERVADSVARDAWQKSSLTRPKTPVLPPPAPKEAAAPKPAPKQRESGAVQTALRRADALYEQAKADPAAADFAAVIAAYQAVLDAAPADSTTAGLARRSLSEARVRAELAGLEQEVARAEAERLAKLMEIQTADEANDLARTAHWGRFDGRGWVERIVIAGEERRFLSWGGETVAEVLCSSGRYDLAAFDGFEVGVVGAMARAETTGAPGFPAQPRLLDLSRIEVISGSGARH